MAAIRLLKPRLLSLYLSDFKTVMNLREAYQAAQGTEAYGAGFVTLSDKLRNDRASR